MFGIRVIIIKDGCTYIQDIPIINITDEKKTREWFPCYLWREQLVRYNNYNS